MSQEEMLDQSLDDLRWAVRYGVLSIIGLLAAIGILLSRQFGLAFLLLLFSQGTSIYSGYLKQKSDELYDKARS